MTDGVVTTILVGDHELTVAVVVPNFTVPVAEPKFLPANRDLHAGLADGWSNRANLRRRRAFGKLPNRNRVRRQRESRHRIITAGSGADRDRNSAEQTRQVIRLVSDRQRRVQSADAVAGRLVLVDGDEHDVAEKLSFVNVDVVVNPTLGHRAVGRRRVVATQRGEFVREL